MLAPNPGCSHWGLFPDDNYIGHFSFGADNLSDEEYAALKARWKREDEERAGIVERLKQGLAEGATVTKLSRRLGITKRKVELLMRRYDLART